MVDYEQNCKIQTDSKLLSRSPWNVIFKSENNKIKLLTEYENVIQNILITYRINTADY
jgi:hypothetical protein